MTTFHYDPIHAGRALTAMQWASDGPVAIAGDAWAQGAMGALLHAEFLAAQAGVVPWFRAKDGTIGLLTIGAARERIDRAPEAVRTIYLATHAAVRQAHARAEPAGVDTPKLGLEPVTAIVISVVAIAAIVGTAWYLSRNASIEVEGRNLRTTAIAAEASRLGLAQLQTTGQIDPKLWRVFSDLAEREGNTTSPWLYAAAGVGVVAIAAGGAVLWNHHQELTQRLRGGRAA